MGGDVTYSGYLDLERILSAQHPASGAHDEMLFIIVHQASELWLKLCLHELAAARALVATDELRPAFKMLSRVARAQEQLIGNWGVLSTMTPHDYSQIRPHLGRSSGFQSAQYRLMEFMLGGRDPDMVTLHEATPEVAAELRSEMGRPSLYDEVLRLPNAAPFKTDIFCQLARGQAVFALQLKPGKGIKLSGDYANFDPIRHSLLLQNCRSAK